MGVPFARDPWNEIIPGLFQGGHDYAEGGVIVRDEFDLVVSFYERTGHGPAAGVQHTFYRIPDGMLTANERADLEEIALNVGIAIEAGRRVLVRCQAGYNRSGLVVALALILLGHTPDDAVRLIRRQRSPYALFNQNFLGYLGAKAGELP